MQLVLHSMAIPFSPIVSLSQIEQVKLSSPETKSPHTFEITYRDGKKSVSIKLSAPSVDVAEMWVSGLQRLTKGWELGQNKE